MLTLLSLLLWVPGTSLSQGGQSAVRERPCASSWNQAAPSRKSKKRKGTVEAAPGGSACIEISSSILEVQEYLQSYVRKQEWKVLEEEMNEDTWDFSLALSKERLVESTKPSAESAKVVWRSGIAEVQVTSTRLPDGFTRTIIHAEFRGYGENQDQFAMPREYWVLASNGKLEDSLIGVLREHFSQVPN